MPVTADKLVTVNRTSSLYFTFLYYYSDKAISKKLEVIVNLSKYAAKSVVDDDCVVRVFAVKAVPLNRWAPVVMEILVCDWYGQANRSSYIST